MSDPEAASRPRFPFVAAALCAACAGAAVWLPVRYWTVLDVTVPELSTPLPPSRYRERHLGRYVRVQVPTRGSGGEVRYRDGTALRRFIWDDWPGTNGRIRIHVLIDRSAPSPRRGRTHRTYSGRVIHHRGMLVVDTTRGRFHGAGIAGLAVGAMGVFVFSVALRSWLTERAALTERSP